MAGTRDIAPPSARGHQHTARRSIRTLRRWFDGALVGGIPTLLARLDGPLTERRHLAAIALVIAHLRGDLHHPAHWRRISGADAPADEIDFVMDEVWAALVEAKLVHAAILYYPGRKRTSASSWTLDELPPRIVGRWVRFAGWSFHEQDEDLFLFGDAYMEPLLRAAADPDAAKRSYAREIVAHAARDHACAAVVSPQPGGDTLATLAPKYARWAKVARETGAVDVAAYLEWLVSYGAPREYDAEEAVQAFLDLTRCAPGERASLQVKEDARGWVGSIRHSGFARPPRVRIDRDTGTIMRVKR